VGGCFKMPKNGKKKKFSNIFGELYVGKTLKSKGEEGGRKRRRGGGMQCSECKTAW